MLYVISICRYIFIATLSIINKNKISIHKNYFIIIYIGGRSFHSVEYRRISYICYLLFKKLFTVIKSKSIIKKNIWLWWWNRYISNTIVLIKSLQAFGIQHLLLLLNINYNQWFISKIMTNNNLEPRINNFKIDFLFVIFT